jgi:hypothetical protein
MHPHWVYKVSPLHFHALTHLEIDIILKENDDVFLNLAKDYLTFATVLSMRPIHRPIHELAILPEVWDGMLPDAQAAARDQGKIRLPVRKLKCFTFILFILLD